MCVTWLCVKINTAMCSFDRYSSLMFVKNIYGIKMKHEENEPSFNSFKYHRMLEGKGKRKIDLTCVKIRTTLDFAQNALLK